MNRKPPSPSALPAPGRTVFTACLPAACAALLAACAEPRVNPSGQHIRPAARPAGTPPPLTSVPVLAPPTPMQRQEIYSVVVNKVPAREVLFALARDARIDIDIAGDIEGDLTLNALNQTLPQLLNRIARQIDMRWEMDGKILQISRDRPFLRNYKVDYVNLARQSSSSVNIATQITGASPIGSAGGGGGARGGTAGNSSLSNVTSYSEHDFWTSLIANIQDLLRESDRILPEGSYEQTMEASSSQQTTGTGAPAPASLRGTTIPSLASSPNPAAMQAAGAATLRRNTFREAASVIANRETGVIAVRASARQHEKIREFMDRVLSNARRQVLIEATIVEVQLNEQSQTGVDWKSVALASGFSFRQNLLGTALDKALPDAARSALVGSIMGDNNLSGTQKSNLIEQIARGMGTLGPQLSAAQAQQLQDAVQGDPNLGAAAKINLYNSINQATLAGIPSGTPGAAVPLADSRFKGGAFPLTGKSAGLTIGYGKGSSFAAAISLLAEFGRSKVISSPKITALNNQTAVLRVVDNLVYFNISAQTTTSQTSSFTTYTSTPNTVAVGFVMSVVPQIDDGNLVTLTVRPTISRLRGYAQDPNPALQNVPNLVPIVQTREMESVMKVPSGNVVMMGGLMEDSEIRGSEGLPTLGDLPGVGRLFSTRNSQAGKTELVIFLRPLVVTDPSLEGDYRFAGEMLPGKDFFNQPFERGLSASLPPASPEAAP